MQQAQSSLSEELVSTVCDLVEAAVHTVLYAKQVYPREWFDRFKFGSVQVFKCRHPAVKSYIGSVVHNLKPLLIKEQVAEVSILLHDEDRQPLQRIILLLEHLVLNPQGASVDWGTLSSQLCSTLIKLQLLDNVVVPGHVHPQPGCHWDVEVRCRAREGVDLNCWEEQPPIAVIPGTEEARPAARRVVPFKTLDVPGLLRLQVLVEACGPLTDST